MSFFDDLELGQKYEKESLKYLDYDDYKIMTGLFKPYDIRIYKNNELTKYEVKCDRLGYKTGNIAIEYHCNDKPSGISTTKSDYYLYFVIKPIKYDLYKIPRYDLIKLCKNANTLYGGDNKMTKLYLVKINLLLKYKITK